MRKLLLFPLFYGFLFPLLSSANDINEEAFDLDLQSLLDIEVTSVSKHSQPLSNAPAAIYVITSEDINRSGATSIPQALRDVPGLHVAQIDSQKWAVSSRGFNGRYNNKLLVMMDGRTLYSPEFSGVYWEVQDTLMTDIERIEIIRGPGAAMWGANAVNGVINIITKHSADTLGGYAEIGAGDYEQGFTGFRYGAKLSEGTTGRAYAKGFKRDSLEHQGKDLDPNLHLAMMDVDTDNDWQQLQVGGRIDMQLDTASTLMLSGDIYQAEMQQTYHVATLTAPYREFNSEESESRGWNVLAKYTRALSADSEYSFQSYFDYAKRDEDFFGYSTKTIDFEFQHQFQAWQNHNVIWGLGFRYIEDEINAHPIIITRNQETDIRLWSGFIRDEISLLPNKLWLTLASRFEHNTYTGSELQPNARLMWQLNDKHKLWSSIAFAVRTPSRAENNVTAHTVSFPTLGPSVTSVLSIGTDDYESEELVSYEMGYRFSPTDRLSFDSTIYYNDYDELRGSKLSAPDLSAFPLITVASEYDNSQSGHNYGVELSSQWLVNKSLRFKANYGYSNSDFSSGQSQNTDAPQHIMSILADWNINNDVNLNLTWRYVDNVNLLDTASTSDKELDSYHGVDIGLSWQVMPNLEIAAYGKNLLYPSHIEYEAEIFHIPYRVEPSYYGKVTLNF